MTEFECSLIKRFAAGDRSLRDSAIEIHRKYLKTIGLTTDEMRFMSEIDNPVPDLSLRGQYRAKLLGKGWP